MIFLYIFLIEKIYANYQIIKKKDYLFCFYSRLKSIGISDITIKIHNKNNELITTEDTQPLPCPQQVNPIRFPIPSLPPFTHVE